MKYELEINLQTILTCKKYLRGSLLIDADQRKIPENYPRSRMLQKTKL